MRTSGSRDDAPLLAPLRIAIIASVVACLADTAHAQCQILAIHDATVSITGRTLIVRVGPLEPRWPMPVTMPWATRVLGWIARPKELSLEYRDRPPHGIETAFAEILTELLASPGRTGSLSPADLVLHAELTGLSLGNRAARVNTSVGLFTGDGRVSTAVRALVQSNDERPIATLTCNRTTLGGPTGEGGWLSLWQSSETLAKQNLRKIGQSLVRQLGRTAEIGQRLAAGRLKDVEVGQLRYTNHVWLERPSDRWSLKDAASVLGTFMTQTSRTNIVGGPPVVAKGIHAVWLTTPAYLSIRRGSELLEHERESMWIHPYFHVFDAGTLQVLESESDSVYAIAVWPFDKAPFYWDHDDIVASTFLRRAGHSDERIPPVALLGAPWPPALFLFPRSDAEGKPLVTTLNTMLELHSTLNGHRLVSKFDLSRFGLRDLNELGVRAGSQPNRTLPGGLVAPQ